MHALGIDIGGSGIKAAPVDVATGKLLAERQKIAAEELKKARASLSLDLAQKSEQLADMTKLLAEREVKLAEAQKAQVEVLKKERELADAKQELDLTLEKRLLAGQAEIKAKAKKEAEGELGLKVQEKEQTIQAMQKQIEELKRKSEQGSQQLQGEVLELQLESSLRTSFPHDAILPVPKGEFGGDVIQEVTNLAGQPCGKILWESKRTRNWSDGWLAKLRNDQRTAKADAAIIVSDALPKSIEAFGEIDGVWVTSPKCSIPVAMAVRHFLIEVSSARKAGEGQQTKMELLYHYLTGPRFRHRVEAIVEMFTAMQEDLDRERRAMQKMWSKREQQIRGVMESTAGMYGDMQGIAGRSLQEIEGLGFDGPDLLDEPKGKKAQLSLIGADPVGGS